MWSISQVYMTQPTESGAKHGHVSIGGMLGSSTPVDLNELMALMFAFFLKLSCQHNFK